MGKTLNYERRPRAIFGWRAGDEVVAQGMDVTVVGQVRGMLVNMFDDEGW